MPENKSTPNPTNPAPNAGAGAKEGEQGQKPLPRYVISPQELRLLGWLKEAKPGERMELLSTAPPVEPGAVRIDAKTRFFNFRIRYDAKKKTLVLKSGGFTVTANALKGIRIYNKDGKILKEYNDCWASRLWSIANTLSEKYGFNIFNEKWQSISLPDSKDVKKFVALVASLINNRIKELKDPFFSTCLDNGSSKTPS
jgi:hypothetical protein